jgi:hypothetical protein
VVYGGSVIPKYTKSYISKARSEAEELTRYAEELTRYTQDMVENAALARSRGRGKMSGFILHRVAQNELRALMNRALLTCLLCLFSVLIQRWMLRLKGLRVMANDQSEVKPQAISESK